MYPNHIQLGQTMTPIFKLENISKQLNKNIYIKREDYTGIELSGNKVRKLEFALAEALKDSANVIITCGALQSNHARATVAAASKLGMKTHLVLRGEEQEYINGNLLIDMIFDAEITYLSEEQFSNHNQVMIELKKQYAEQGQVAYIIPLGASNGIGNFGYVNVFNEIAAQEKDLGISFDTIVCAIGSGGTYSGLLLGNKLNQMQKRIIGYSVGGSSNYFTSRCVSIMNESQKYLNVPIHINEEDIIIKDRYQGSGYAKTSESDILFIKSIAKLEGIVLDPVYTGKAFKGMYTDIEEQVYNDSQNILFIHTGGIFGIGAFSEWFHMK